MKIIWLTKGQFTLVDDEDYETLSKFKWMACVDNRVNTIYSKRMPRVNGKHVTVLMHRFILGINDRSVLIDHADRNGLNNQRSNLRVATVSQNAANRKSRINSTSEYLGVSWAKKNNKWIVHIRDNGVRKHIGVFINEKDAASAYNCAALKIHGDFANLNKI